MKDKVKKPRVDKRKNIWKVAEVLAKNPNKTTREIAEKTWLSIWAVHSSKKEVEKSWTKDKTIAYIVDSARDRIKKASGLFDRFMRESEVKEQLNIKDITTIKDIVKDDMQRITVLWWAMTDDKWWLKDFNLADKTIKELEEWRQSLLW